MSSLDPFFEESFKIRSSEIGLNEKATLPAICDLMQEIAGNHAVKLKFDITDLQRKHLTWVLYRLQLQMDRLPNWRETIKIRTWPSGSDGLRAHRDFLIMDKNDQIIGKAISYWLILNMESRRPQPVPDSLINYCPGDIDPVIPMSKGNFSELKQPEEKYTINVRASDLDLNRHVNNVRYIEWMEAGLSSNVNPKSIDIKFVGEAVENDTVIASRAKNSQHYDTQIHRAGDAKILAQAHFN